MEKQTVTQNLSCVWEPLKQTVKGERWIATVHRSSIQMRRRVEADASAKSVVSDQGSACRILLMSMWASVPGRGGMELSGLPQLKGEVPGLPPSSLLLGRTDR